MSEQNIASEIASWSLWDGMTPKQFCDCLSYINGDPTIDDVLRWADDGGQQP